MRSSECGVRSKNVRFVIGLAAVFLVSSCGYHFSGTGAVVPEGLKTISIPVFFNGTNEPYIDVEVTQAVVEEFMTDGRLKVVGLEEADLALIGRVIKYEVKPLSYNSASSALQYQVHLVVQARLENVRSKKILWQEPRIESGFISDYAVSYDVAGRADIGLTKIAKEAAIKKASQDMAWTLRSRVLEGF